MGIFDAVGGLIDGYFQREKEDEWRSQDQERQDTQLQRLVEDAKSSGISPLAALGGNVNYATGSAVNRPSSMGVGKALAAVGNKWADRERDKLDLENMKLQNDLTRARIEALKEDTVQTSMSRTIGNEAKLSELLATAEGYTLPFTKFAPATPLLFGGQTPGRNLGYSDTEQVEAVYGGLVGDGYGIARLLQDVLQNSAKQASQAFKSAAEWRAAQRKEKENTKKSRRQKWQTQHERWQREFANPGSEFERW